MISLSVSVTFTLAPSGALTVSTLPSKFSTVPLIRTVCGCCAKTCAPIAIRNAPARIRAVNVVMTFSRDVLLCCVEKANARRPKPTRSRATGVEPAPSHRRREVAADVDRRREQRAVGLGLRGEDDDLRARLDLGLVARRISHDRRRRRNENLLLAVLVLDRDRLPIDAGHDGVDRGVGHGAPGLQVPLAEAFAGAALRFAEDMDGDRLLGAVGLRHRGD